MSNSSVTYTFELTWDAYENMRMVNDIEKLSERMPVNRWSKNITLILPTEQDPELVFLRIPNVSSKEKKTLDKMVIEAPIPEVTCRKGVVGNKQKTLYTASTDNA